MRPTIVRLTGGIGALALGAALLGAPPAGASERHGRGTAYAVTVTVENAAPETGTLLTPFWVGLHDGGFDLYDRDAPASAELERLAEDGNTMPISGAFAASAQGRDTTIAGPGGPLQPGESGSTTLVVDPSVSRYLSFASMVIPSNDAFIANGDPLAHPIFDEDGNFAAQTIEVPGSAVLDAGTEVNDEVPENTAALAQAMPDTGVMQGGVVTTHAGFQAGGNILAAHPAADFTASGYVAARVTVSAVPVDLSNRSFLAVADGGQEVPSNGSGGAAWTVLKVRKAGTAVRVDARVWGLDGLSASHLHLGVPGENGPVVVDLGEGIEVRRDGRARIRLDITADDLVGPLAGTSLASLVQALDDGEIYVNFHTEAFPGGEIRGQFRN